MIYILTTIITLIIDQLSKGYILANFKLYQSRPVFGKFLQTTYTTNTGGAFGVMSQFPSFFVVLAIIMGICGVIFAKKLIALKKSYQLGVGLILGGTLGNLIDRLRFGHVVDFIDFSFWPTFNVADIAICVGSGLMIILLLKNETWKEDAGEDSEENEKHRTDGESDIETVNEGCPGNQQACRMK